jgi:hypothetical protein
VYGQVGIDARLSRVTPKPLEVLPMQLQVGDRFRDEEGVWEVTGHPFTTRDGKVVHATIQQPGQAASAREKTWGAHEKLTIERSVNSATSRANRKSKDPKGKRARRPA